MKGLELLSEISSGSKKKEKGLSKLLSDIQNRLNRGKNVITIFEGETGSGKSTGSLSLNSMLDPVWLEDPVFAGRNLIVFSALEFIIIEAYLLKHNGGIFRGRFLAIEEAEASVSSIPTAAAVQEFKKHVQVFRQWQINLTLNLPFSDDILDIKNKTAHYIIWTEDVDEERQIVRARWRKRLRIENAKRPYFLNPYLADKKIIDPSVPGAKIEIPFAHPKLWEVYQQEKQKFFIELNRRSFYRIKRLDSARSDLSVAIVRPHFKQFEEYIDKDDLAKVSEMQLKYEKAKQLKSNPNTTALEKAALILYLDGSMTLRDLQRKMGQKWTKKLRDILFTSEYFRVRKRNRKDSYNVNLTEKGIRFVEDLLEDLEI